MQDEEAAQATARSAGRQAEALDRRKWRADRKTDLDELLPKATGRWGLKTLCSIEKLLYLMGVLWSTS